MRIEESHRRQDELEKLLYSLASSAMDEAAICDAAEKLKDLYTEGFRHTYSRFFPLVVEIFKEDNEYSQDFLSENLEQMRSIVEKDYFDTEDKDKCRFVGLYKPLTKLADHISLEIGRYSQSLINEDRIKDLEKRNLALQEQLSKSKDDLDKMNKDMQNTQKEYVAILGIFAAVVLTFTGGIAFTTSVFENIASVSIYRITFISVVIGIVLTNILLVLFYHVDRIIHGSSRQIIKPLIVANIVFALLLFGTFGAWRVGLVESRNNKIEQKQQYSVVETGESSVSDTNNTIEDTVSSEDENIDNISDTVDVSDEESSDISK